MRRASGFGWAMLVAALAHATSAHAQTPPAPSPAPSPLPRAPIQAAVARVADTIARSLGSAGRGLVVASTLVTDTPAPRAAALIALVAAQIAGKIGHGSHARAEATLIGPAREAAKVDGALVYLGVEIASGKLRVTADVYPVPHTVWSRIRDPEPASIAHAFAEAPIDAEIRAHLAPIPLTAASVERAKNFESDVVALACGDVDGDGALEIVSMSRRRVTTLRLRGGKVVPITSRSWPDLAGVAPSPLREPIGFASIGAWSGGAPFVDVALTDRARSVRLDGSLGIVASFPGFALADGEGTACARMTNPVVTGMLAPCVPGDPAPRTTTVGGKYDAFASAVVTSPRGQASVVWAGREGSSLELRDDAGRKDVEAGVGAQVAVGDLDQDGDPEVISSLDVANALEDAVVVRTWKRGAPKPADASTEILRIPAAAGVHAIAVCPPDGPGRAPFVVATADEIWVVR